MQINPQYFRIRKALERRLYEIVHKRCKNKYKFSIYLKELYEETGSISKYPKFIFHFKKISTKNKLLDYKICLDKKKGKVTFIKNIKNFKINRQF